jgi:hypothetical protein
VLDRFPRFRIRWDFFFECGTQELKNLEEWYYTWYEFDANLVIGMILILAIGLFITTNPPYLLTWFLVISIVALARDGWILRREIKRHVDDWFGEPAD